MKQFFLVICLLVMTFFDNAQTADEIINKYITAMGGKDKLNSIQSVHFTGISIGQNGNEITTDIWKVNNKLYRRNINFGAGSQTTLITDKGGWQTNFRSGGTFETMQEQQRNNQLYEMDCAGPIVDYAAKGHKVELVGKETIDGKENYKIKLTTKEGRELNYYFDAATGYINRLSFRGRGRPGADGTPGAEIDIVVNYTNYDKTTDGYTFAFSQTVTGGFGGTMTFEKIDVNPKIEDKLYKAE